MVRELTAEARRPRTRNARPYEVEENTDQENAVSIALTASDISILARANAVVTNTPDVKYAS
ncbi:MAG: hypothetical protein UIH27_13055 [Ruminococcus sp.]|nr:hypothetical protein [Ruminococcus sp.]